MSGGGYIMKKITLRTLAAAMSLMMLLTGCSEGNETDSSTAEITTASQSSEESSAPEETTQGVEMPAEGDIIPWEGEGDPLAGQQSSSQAQTTTKAQTTTAASTAATTKAAPQQQNNGGGNSGGNNNGGGAKTAPAATTKAPAPAPTPASGTPVQRHGALKVSGNHIVDSRGNTFMLQGMSTHGIMWEDFSNILSVNSLRVLRDDWRCNAVRIAMYTEEWGGYTTGYAAQAKAKVINGVANATSLGMYVIIDWHILQDGNPQTHQREAIDFFKEMAETYKNYSNVIFELCNEPNGGANWQSNIKPYCQAVVNTIRAAGAKNLVICGTGTWSQDIDKVLGNRLSDANCLYTLHFYANTHTDWLRQRLQNCYNSGLPVLVTEFGTCDASGNYGFNESQTRAWYNLLKNLKVGWFNWSAANKNETASAFKVGTNLANISAGESQLTQSGRLIRTLFRENAAANAAYV